MYGICLLHSITQAGHNRAWAANLFEWCVPGFAFISGWCGVRFSWRKVFLLFATSIYCTTVFFAFDVYVHGGKLDIWKIYGTAVNQWFLTAYVVMMCLAPIVEVMLERVKTMLNENDIRSVLKIVSPYMVCVFVWSFACTLPGIMRVMPKAEGLRGYSFTMLLGVYIFARLVKYVLEAEHLRFTVLNRKIILLPCLACCLGLAATGMGDYQSPFSLGIATCTFLLFMRLRVSAWLQKVLVFLAPSMFSVYLIHAHGLAWDYLAFIENGLLHWGCPLSVAYVLTAATVFGVSIIGDLPRRVFVWIFTQNIFRKCKSNV